jgi:hypothetical protein
MVEKSMEKVAIDWAQNAAQDMIQFMLAEAVKAIFGKFETFQNPLEVKIAAMVIEEERAAKHPKINATTSQINKSVNNTHYSHVKQAQQLLLQDKAQMETKMMAMQKQIDNLQKPQKPMPIDKTELEVIIREHSMK